jgi:DNA-binding transcriptional LysR family regulator
MQNYQTMEFRHLTSFVTVAEELHFRRAAERLHIVQPALSQQIAKLEAELGVQLLERTNRRVTLTDAGRVFLDDARAMLRLRDRAISYARTVQSGTSGALNIGYVGPSAYSGMPQLIRAFRRDFPQVDLRLHELTTRDQVEGVVSGRLDVGICRLPASDDRLNVSELWVESTMIALPAEHALAGQEQVRLADLATDRFILVARAQEPTAFDTYLSLCLAAGFSPIIVEEAQQIHSIIELVAAGLGVALVPSSLSALSRPGVYFRALEEGSQAQLHTALIWRRGTRSPLVGEFLKATTQHVHGKADGAE